MGADGDGQIGSEFQRLFGVGQGLDLFVQLLKYVHRSSNTATLSGSIA